MDDGTFDRIARLLAAGVPKRRFLRGAGAAGDGAVVGLPLRQAAAQRRKRETCAASGSVTLPDGGVSECSA